MGGLQIGGLSAGLVALNLRTSGHQTAEQQTSKTVYSIKEDCRTVKKDLRLPKDLRLENSIESSAA